MVSAINQTTFKNIEPQTKKTNNVSFCSISGSGKTDNFEKRTDKSNNGKFDLSEAGKNFLKGIISPVTALVKHPLMTIGIIGGTILTCSLVPVLAPVTAIGFGALSLYQLGKGCYNATKLYKNGQYDAAEKAFDEIGQGTAGVALTAVGVKQSARVAKEAKMMNELNVNSLTKAQKESVALEVKEGSFVNALKEIGSLFTTKSGLKATLKQFRPSNISQRGTMASGRLNIASRMRQIRAVWRDARRGIVILSEVECRGTKSKDSPRQCPNVSASHWGILRLFCYAKLPPAPLRMTGKAAKKPRGCYTARPVE